MRRFALPLLAIASLCGVAGADTKSKVKVTTIDGVDVEVHTAKAYRVMAKAARKDGVHLGIRSGFRSYAQQEHLYNLWLAGKGNPAAPPGMSNHENGRALDIKLTDPDASAWLKKHAARYGFRATVPGEPWHWEFDAAGETKTVARPKHRTHAH